MSRPIAQLCDSAELVLADVATIVVNRDIWLYVIPIRLGSVIDVYNSVHAPVLLVQCQALVVASAAREADLAVDSQPVVDSLVDLVLLLAISAEDLITTPETVRALG